MSIEEAMMGGIVFKGKKEKPKEENKIKTKAKKKTYHRPAWFRCGENESRNPQETREQA